MAHTVDKVIIDDGEIKIGQYTKLVRVIKVVQNDGTHPRFEGKVRCIAHRDNSYAFQSRYTAEVWSGSAWKTAASLEGTFEWAKNATLSEVCDRLLADAKLVLL